tara:strand:- start:357 stop:896 length:540 start_codon:yes stop_codon:yes gene_type:complete
MSIFRTDTIIRKNVIEPISKILCFIHPNIITLSNFITVYFLLKNFLYKEKTHVAIILICINRLIDILDGSIARNCNKESKIGGVIDMLCDHTLIIGILIIYLIKIYKLNINIKIKIIISIVIISFIVYLLYLIFLHIFKKSYYTELNNKTIFSNIILFIMNNTVILSPLITLLFKKILT